MILKGLLCVATASLFLCETGVATRCFSLESARAGQNIFKSHCILCHGLDATGSTNLGRQLKARNLRLPEVQRKNAGEIRHVISEGKGDMPAFAAQLSSEQIEEVVAYVKQLKTVKK